MPDATIVSYRLGGPDGVSVEAAKWGWAMEQLGFRLRTVAGEGAADLLVPGLAMAADQPPTNGEVARALDEADLVVVENLCSLPLNPMASEVVAAALRGRRALLHHHDLPWQRDRFAGWPGPPDDRRWSHVTVNHLSRRQLAERGIGATTVYNSFHPEPPRGSARAARHRLGMQPEERLLLHPVRAVPRKNVPAAVALAEALGATYWLTGPAEEGYGRELERVLGAAAVPVRRGLGGLTPEDAYAACDAVALPSHVEGFGNPAVESALHRRPLAIGSYPVAAELRGHGFRWFPAHDASPLDAWLRRPDAGLLDHNQAVARHHFSLATLPDRLSAVLDGAGWTSW